MFAQCKRMPALLPSLNGVFPKVSIEMDLNNRQIKVTVILALKPLNFTLVCTEMCSGSSDLDPAAMVSLFPYSS